MNLSQFNVYFDGGGSHDFAYGSWEVVWNGFKKREHRLNFKHWRSISGKGATSNVAEFLSLIGALEWLQSVKEKNNYTISIHGDSMLVINQLTGRYKCRKEHLRILRDDAVVLLQGWKDWTATWQSRINNLSRFGH